MKYVLVLGLLIVSALAADWQRVVGSSAIPVPPYKEVVASDTLGIDVQTTIFGFSEQDTTIDNKGFKRIEIPEELRQQSYEDTTLAGKPEIPYVKLLIAVPDSVDFEITVDPYGCTQFDDYLLYPTPRIVFEHTAGCAAAKEVYTYDTAFYQLDTLYPGIFYEMKNAGHWRDQRVLELILYPVQCNPKREIMYLYDELYVTIAYSGTAAANENGLGPFESLGRATLLNYPGIDRQPPPHDPPSVHYYTSLLDPHNVADYLIVTHQDFLDNDTASYWIHELAQWRVEHNEFDVGIVSMSDILDYWPPADSDSLYISLKEFLVHAYDYWQAPAMPDGHFAYCLFVGDWDYVPARLDTNRTSFTWPGQPSTSVLMLEAYESYFRDLDTPMDDLDDIMLGRFPVKVTHVQDLVTIAQKTINYERSPDTTMWRRRGVLAAVEEEEAHITTATPYFSDIAYDTLTVRRSCCPNDSAFCCSVQTCLNLGNVLTDYWGHGAPGGWLYGYDTSYVKQLINDGQLSFTLNYACLTAMFQWDHPWWSETPFEHPWHPGGISMGEYFLFNQNGGAVAFEGGAIYITGEDVTRMALERILRDQTWIIGQAVVNFGRDYCLLGDPALDLGDYTAFPNLPDLTIRPRGMDVELSDPFPYPSNGDLVPVAFSVWNIGAVAAHDVEVRVRLKVPLFQDTATVMTLTIDSITPRDSTAAQFMWDPTVYHLDNGQTVVLPDYVEGEIGQADFSFVVDPDNDIVESWEGNNVSRLSHTLALYPNEANWPKKLAPPVSQPAIGDLDGDGVPEVVMASHDSLYVFDHNGNLLNSGWPRNFPQVHGVVLGDIDNDDVQEIVAVSRKYVRAYDHLGQTLWSSFIYLNETHDIVRLPSLGRIEDNSSPYLDIIVIADPKWEPEVLGESDQLKLLVYDHEGNLVDSFACSQTYTSTVPACNTAASVSDVDDHGEEDIVVSYSYPSGAGSGSKTEIFNKFGNVKILTYGGDLMTSALADVSNPNDKVPDVITGGIDRKMRAYDVKNDVLLWERETEGPINSSPAVGDIHPAQPGVEITFGNDRSRVHLREHLLGDPVFPWPYIATPSAMVRTSPAIANINDDNYPDVIFGANNGYVYAFNYNMDTIAPYPLPLFGKPSSPLIGDIDGDRESELVVASSDGYLHVWANRASEVIQYSLEWPQFHHDYQRTGLYNWVSRLSGGDANPKEFSTATTISFTLHDNLHTQIKVYDAQGNIVKDLVNQTLAAGTYNPVWFGKDNNYVLLPNGLYFVEIRVNNESKIITVEINR